MEKLTNENYKKVVEFVLDNIEKSLFVYGNLQLDNKIVNFLEVDNKIKGLYIIIEQKYITYLFDDLIKDEEIETVFTHSLKYKFIEGTVVNVSKSLLKKYFTLREEEKIIYIANLDLNSSNDYAKSSSVELLQIDNTKDVKRYIEQINKIEEFEEYTKENLQITLLNSKIYVYKLNGEILGAATLCAISDKTAVITSVFVNQEERRQGIAFKILTHLLKDNSDVKRNISIFFNNPIAKELYIKIGFDIKNTMEMIKNNKNN